MALRQVAANQQRSSQVHRAPALGVCPALRAPLRRCYPKGVSQSSTFVVLSSTRPGGSVLDAPTISPGIEKSSESLGKRPPTYKVLLHNDNYNRREYVVRVLLKVVDGITMETAVSTMQEAHETGVGMVIACPQEDAERFCEGLRLNGLTSTIEPGC